MIKERNWKIDYLKGIGIFFVLMGHILSGGITYNFIFNFHMELFFAIAGYLLYFDSAVNFNQFIIKKIKALIVPYYVLCLFSFVFITVISYPDLPYLDYRKILGILFFDSKCLKYISNLPLWFLSHLFFCYIILYFIKKTKLFIQMIIVIFCMLIVLPYQKYVIDYAYSIGALPVSITFMILGFNFAKYRNLISEKYILKYSSVIGWMLILIGYILSNFYKGQTMSLNNHMVALIACIIISGLVLITETGNKAIEFIGRNSLYIFGIHQLFIKYIVLIYKGYIPHLVLTEGANEFFITLTLLFVCLILTYAYLKFKHKKLIIYFVVFSGVVSLFLFEKFDIKNEIKFSKNPPIMMNGFSYPENWGVWTNGNVAELKFSWRNKNDLDVSFDIKPFLPNNALKQNVDVFVNNKKITNWQFEKDKPYPISVLRLSKDDFNTKDYTIRFEIENPKSPKELGISKDARKLGIGFKSMKIKEIKEP